MSPTGSPAAGNACQCHGTFRRGRLAGGSMFWRWTRRVYSLAPFPVLCSLCEDGMPSVGFLTARLASCSCRYDSLHPPPGTAHRSKSSLPSCFRHSLVATEREVTDTAVSLPEGQCSPPDPWFPLPPTSHLPSHKKKNTHALRNKKL